MGAKDAAAFLGTPLLAARGNVGRWRAERRTRRVAARSQLPQPVMIQSPDSDGPPDLDGYFASMQQRQQAATSTAPPITLGTGRASIAAHNGDVAATVRAAAKLAAGSMDVVPQLCHVTLALDVAPDDVAGAVHAELGDVPVMGRSVNKKGGDGCVEVLVLATAAGGGVAVAAATASAAAADPESDTDDRAAALDAACQRAVGEAADEALRGMVPDFPPTFFIYAHSAGARDGVARAAIAKARPGAIAYGGAAAADQSGWVVLSPQGAGGRQRDPAQHTAVVAAVPGKISFLFSAVVKNWAQPKFTEALSYMTPSYTGDAGDDLLTAIRYDDWGKFIYCLEEAGVSVNHRWVDKQSQQPLLAACARLRSRMVEYLVEHGADVEHRNDGGFTAAMYTRMLTEHDRDVVLAQLATLEKAGARTTLTRVEIEQLKKATNGKIFQ